MPEQLIKLAKDADYLGVSIAYVVAVVFGAAGGACSSSAILFAMSRLKRNFAIVAGLTISGALAGMVCLSAIFTWQFFSGVIAIRSLEAAGHIGLMSGSLMVVLSMLVHKGFQKLNIKRVKISSFEAEFKE